MGYDDDQRHASVRPSGVDRVLFVDDDPTVRRAFGRLLRRAGFIVDLAETGEAALQLATQYPYAVVAADLVMVGMNGATLLAKLRAVRPYSTYMLVTGAPDQQWSGQLSSVADFATVVQKPWSSEQLLESVRRGAEAYSRRRTISMPPPRPDGPDTQRLLLVEDMFEDAELLRRRLRKHGNSRFEVEHCSTLTEALHSLKSRRFVAVLADLGLPDAEGLEVVAALRHAAPDTPVIVVSGSDDPEVGMDVLKQGAQDYIPKARADAWLVERAVRHAVERIRSDARVQYAARFDDLTGLANRTLLRERLAQAIAHASRTGIATALVCVDIDHFQRTNETHGQPIGDELLCEVAARLVSSVGDADTVARLGADTFGVLLHGLGQDHTHHALMRIRSSFATPFMVDDRPFPITASIGIALAPDNAETTDQLLQFADSAMHRAKANGRNTFCFFDPETHAQSTRKARLEASVREAVELEQFELHYQPQVCLQTGRLVGLEALLRWQQTSGSWVSPLEFIPALESTGLIVPVGEWVLRQACAQLSRWRDGGMGELRMAVNISGRQFQAGGLYAAVMEAVREHGLTPQCLELEITESVLLDDAGAARSTLEQLVEQGVRVAMDDFGTGYSSLSYLTTFPVHVLKVDRSFVGRMSEDASCRTITEAVVRLGQALGLETVAEGVESEEQQAALKALGCSLAQGYGICRPRAPAGLEEWFNKAA